MALIHSDLKDLDQVMDNLIDFKAETGLIVEAATVRCESGTVVNIDWTGDKTGYEVRQ